MCYTDCDRFWTCLPVETSHDDDKSLRYDGESSGQMDGHYIDDDIFDSDELHAITPSKGEIANRAFGEEKRGSG